MKNSTRIFSLSLIVLLAFFGHIVQAQSVLNPTDSVYTYNSAAPPTQPAYGTIGKWVRTKKLSWNTNGYKAYIYKGNPFRLYFPKSYNPTANDGKKYPLLIFYHGVGEAYSTIYDNEEQLYHGGQVFQSAVDKGTFDGYVLCMQTAGGWGINQYTPLTELIDYMIANNKVDPFRVTNNGLSGGGGGTWNMYLTYPTYIAGIIPMSSVDINYTASATTNLVKYTPIWNIHGGLDGAPAPYTATQVANAMAAVGANYTDLDMTTQSHDTWDSTWSMPAFWPFLVNAYSSNPWTLFGRTQFCPGDPINVTIGVVTGFQAYQWRKNGVVISGATANTISVKDTGTYDCRVERNGNWSSWSPIPVVIAIKKPTITPPITVSGTMSRVLSAPDGNSTVNLMVPAGYASYLWQKVGSTATIGTANVLPNATPGSYVVQVTEQYGCSSNFSPAFTVASASGPNKPDAASGLNVSALSPTSLLLNWSQNPTPTYNETGFEVYQGTHTGGPYKLVGITRADVTKDTLTGLSSGTTYYYIVRAVDSTSAAAASSEASGKTIADTIPPTAPSNLTVTGSTRSSVSLGWGTSTDNVGVTEYDIYINGAKSYVVGPGTTQFTVYNLNFGQSYAFVVKAADLAGNSSPGSAQVSAEPLAGGLSYNFYTLASTPTALPNMSTLSPAVSGQVANISLTPATQSTNYAFLYQGYLHITTAGTYSFRTTSADGSKLYLGALNSTASAYSYSGTAVVSNDGSRNNTATVTSSNITLQKGIYPIAVAFFEASGTASLSVTWKIPGSSSYVAIPNSAFVDTAVDNGDAPAAPSNVTAVANSYNKIALGWTDNSTNESGFEVWRSTSATTGFNPIGTTAAGATSFVDSGVSASTRYYYQVRAVSIYGQSLFASNYTQARWQFNNSYVDSTGNGRTATAVGTPTFDASNKAEGVYSIKLNGSNQAVTLPNTSSFLQEAYSQRTISLWLKSNSTTVTNGVIFDIGGSDNGLALILNKTTLIAAVASGSTRTSISTTYSSTAWNHIAVVYNGDSLLLYVNGVLAASNTSLSFHTLSTTTNGARIGQTNGTNAYNTTGTYFNGWIDDFGVYSNAFSAATINAIKNFTYVQSNATTAALPAIPAVPASLRAAAASSSSINMSWNNNATTATSIQVYRSATDNQSYVLWATLPAGTVSFSDSALFANAKYYYKLKAVNAGGSSAYSTEVSATTLDNLPVITELGSQQARYGTTTTVAVSATHVGGGTLIFTSANLPAFASLTDNHDGTAALNFTPAVADQKTYSNLQVIVTDAAGGADTTKFSLVVNNNYAPVIDTVASYVIHEGDTLSIPLTSHENNAADTLKVSVSGAPAGYTLTPGTNGNAVLFLHPGYAASGVYSTTVTVDDNNGLSAVRTFTITVKDKSPNTKIFTRVAYNDLNAIGLPWNALLGTTNSNLLDSSGNTTTVGLNFTPSNWWTPFNGGSSTGNNSGVYPDAVLQNYMWWGSLYGGPDVFNGQLTGLDTAQQYSLTFYANSTYNGFADNGTSTYTVGSQTVSLAVQNNRYNTATISNIKPAADGTISIAMGKTSTTPLGYFSAMVITRQYDDGQAPAGASMLSGQAATGKVSLSWQDSAYNALGYQIWRAPASTGAFVQVGTVAGNSANAYVDTTVVGNTKYLYAVRAYNNRGNSGFSDTVTLTTLNRLPKVTAIADVSLKNNESQTINVTTVDDPGVRLTLTATGLPTFATFVDNGDGTGTINITPSAGTVGIYPNITVTAADPLDSVGTASFTLAVTEPNVSSVYVNFTGGPSSPKPWNTLQTPPFANTVMSNLLDDGGNATNISLTMTEGFYWFSNSGRFTGNNDGVYPSVVLRNGVYEPTTATRHLVFSGLDATKTYNFVFFNSQCDGTNGLTNFTINGQTVSLQAMFNINKTVQINGIVPDASGTVTIAVSKDVSASNAYLSSIVVQGYATNSAVVLNPTDLRSLGYTQHTVTLQWQDRAANETGFEVWRASSAGSYAKVVSLPAGTTSYTDGGLTANSNYYYIVRAVMGSTTSDYSNVLAVTTAADQLYINVNSTSAGNAPWNNLNSVPEVGTIWNNFADSSGNLTSTGMSVTQEWAGLNALGNVTGNNAGVYPDAVIKEDYVAFQGQVGGLQLFGLNLSKTYDITFFGSDNLFGDNTSAYIINGDTVFLNAMFNTNATVTMHGVKPDNSGKLNIYVAPYGQASGGGWLNAFVIQGYTASTSNAPAPPVTTNTASNIRVMATGTNTAVTAAQTQQTISMDTVAKAYPNPFVTFFTLQIPAFSNNEKAKVSIFNVAGQQVYAKEFGNLVQGDNFLRVDANSSFTKSGVYFVRVVYGDAKTIKTFKLLKN